MWPERKRLCSGQSPVFRFSNKWRFCIGLFTYVQCFAYDDTKRIFGDYMDFNRRILPFYMTYPGGNSAARDQDHMRDLEYLQQMYPQEIKRYQRRIAEVLDKLDYEGSMIYDEYPDRYQLERTAKSIIELLKKEEQESQPEAESSSEKWEWLQKLVFVLLNNEVYKRRHGGRRSYFIF